jgi:hypothetical protein
MNTCQWCGDRHGVDQLCQRAQRGMTRRSFCFLFGAGVAGAMLPTVEQPTMFMGRPIKFVDDLGVDAGLHFYNRVNVYLVKSDGSHALIGTFPSDLVRSVNHVIRGDGSEIVTGIGPHGETVPNLIAQSYRKG